MIQADREPVFSQPSQQFAIRENLRLNILKELFSQ